MHASCASDIFHDIFHFWLSSAPGRSVRRGQTEIVSDQNWVWRLPSDQFHLLVLEYFTFYGSRWAAMVIGRSYRRSQLAARVVPLIHTHLVALLKIILLVSLNKLLDYNFALCWFVKTWLKSMIFLVYWTVKQQSFRRWEPALDLWGGVAYVSARSGPPQCTGLNLLSDKVYKDFYT